MTAKTKTIHYCSAHTTLPQGWGEFQHVNISERQQSLRCGQNLHGPFLRATLPDRALERWRTMGREKGSQLHHQGEFLV